MFKKIMLLLAISSPLYSASATSLDPCTPVQDMSPDIMTCSAHGVYYSIIVNSIVPNRVRCPEEYDKYTTTTAHIQMRVDDNILATFTINEKNDFEYKMGSGNGTFKSENFNVDLNNCTSPHFGALSIGN